MRLKRNRFKRHYKTASKHKRAPGPEGLWCPICNPRRYAKLHRQDMQAKADARHMEGKE